MATRANKKVLIIDDDPRFCSLLAGILSAQGWRAFTAAEGEAGLKLLRRHRPGIVLCDLLMPRCNGFQVCRAVRADVALAHTRIIVTSGRDYESDRRAAREAGADEYLTKPFQPAELLALLARNSSEVKPSAGSRRRKEAERPQIQSGSSASSRRRLPVQEPAQFRFWGVRGSVATPGPSTVRFGGNTSCVEVRAAGEIIILDAGTGLRALGQKLVEEFGDAPLRLTLLLTHTHWDHIQGLPFFAPIYRPNCRLRILGYEGARKGLVNVLSGQFESPYFPVPFGQLPGNVVIEELKEMKFRVGDVRVEAFFANHPGICVGYRVNTPEGSLAFFPDNEPHCRHDGAKAVASTKAGATLSYARAEERKFVRFLRGVDALILDSQYTRAGYEQHVGWGHGCVDDAVAIATQARAKKLFLFHHDPANDDAQVARMAAHARRLVAAQRSNLHVEAARECVLVKLPFKP